MTWKPLLDGETAGQAQHWIHRFADQWKTPRPEAPEDGPARGGLAGLALFFAYLARTTDDDRFASLAEQRLDEALERCDISLRTGLFSGFTGIAWTCQHLSRLLTGEAAPDLASDVDEAVALAAGTRPPGGGWPHDLTEGLAGLGCYAVDHPDRDFASSLLARIVERLAETAVPLVGGVAWRTSPFFLEPELAAHFPDGWFDLGVAHGTPGVLGMLGRACGSGLAPPAARDLLEGGVRFLLATRRPEDEGSRYSRLAAGPQSSMQSFTQSFSCYSAWCQGDPGIAAALLTAARHAGDASLEAEAVRTALHDCARPDEGKGVVDATLCHGMAGLGHLYNRLYQATGVETFADAARRWLERTVTELMPAAFGPSGAWSETDGRASSILEGGSGIGLALIAATSSLEPSWDSPMLLPGLPGISGRS